ncbi:hypothetical protein ACFL6E_04620 [Candidatus Neomarinimicrobiota bacterium]
MNCADFRGRISPFLDSELSFTEQKHFGEHRAQCSTCDSLLENMELTKQYLTAELSVSLSSDFVDRLRARLNAELEERPSWWQNLLEPKVFGLSPASLSGLVAAAVVMMIIGSSLFTQQTAPLLEPSGSAVRAATPPAMIPSQPVQTAPPAPMLTNSALDTTAKQATPRRDFFRQIKYVNKDQNPN